uniref:BED-type domain-containing protein n=1 Tax=Meloidogyne floridensis TaxID=298350 RepID=A0A915NSJ8_9BILA
MDSIQATPTSTNKPFLKKRSPTWNFFKIDENDDKRAICNECGSSFSIKFPSRNREDNSQLKKHMRDRHPEINIGVYESKDKTTCHFCSASILSKSLYFHFNKQQCKNNFYANNGWSIIFNETDVTSFKEEQFFTQLSITNGRYMVYVVRKNSLINDWCYVGITNALEKRFNQHKTDKTFGMYESVEYGVLKDGLSYENASLIGG